MNTVPYDGTVSRATEAWPLRRGRLVLEKVSQRGKRDRQKVEFQECRGGDAVYRPKHFAGTDEVALRIIDEFPFATLVTVARDQVPIVSHIPIIFDRAAQHGEKKVVVLEGHLARGNPHWRVLQEGGRSVAIFHGPHTYVSPSWYVSGRDVPTWNYAVVHVTGQIALVEDPDGIVAILRRTTERFERMRAMPWEFSLPDDLATPAVLPRAIVGFTLTAETVTAKVKLNQNRQIGDRQGVIQGLAGERTDDMSRMVADWMRATLAETGE